MPPTGTSRGYGTGEDETPLNPVTNDASHSLDHNADHSTNHLPGADAGGGHGHGHDDVLDPDTVVQSDSSLDDIYITSAGKPVDGAPLGYLPPTRILDTMIPDPIPYRVDIIRAAIAGVIATLVFTPIFYCLYFGYKDNCYDLGLLLGSAISPALDWTTRLLGLAIHLGIGGVMGVTFAYMLYVFRTQSNGGRGTQFGILMTFAMMGFLFPLFVGVLPVFVPWRPHFDNPDFLLNQSGPSNVGWGPLVVALMAHMMWGLILGHLYRHKVVIRQSETTALGPITA